MGLPFVEDTVNNYYVYCIEGGSDSNDGLTPATAVLTMNKASDILNTYTGAKRRYMVIVKHKILDDTLVTRTSTKPITFLCLNRTIIDGSGTSAIILRVDGDVIINAMITGYNSRSLFSISGNINPFFAIFKCLIIDNTYSGGVVSFGGSLNTNMCTLFFTNSVSVNTTKIIYSNTKASIYCINSVLITSGIATGVQGLLTNLLNCNIGVITSIGSSGQYTINYCNIYGTIDGQDNAYYQASPRFQNLTGRSQDPLFNAAADNVYTVSNTSPCLYTGQNNQHIGIGEALYLTGEDLFTDAVDSDNLELLGTKLIRTDVDEPAFLETANFHNGSNRIVNLVELAATLGFVADALVQSVQLPSTDTPTPYPLFLTFKIKVATSEAGLSTADWITLPFNQQPLIDEAGLGNGTDTFDSTDTLTYLKLNWFKLYISIENLA